MTQGTVTTSNTRRTNQVADKGLQLFIRTDKNKRLKTPVILLQNILNKACKVTLQVSASTRETEGKHKHIHAFEKSHKAMGDHFKSTKEWARHPCTLKNNNYINN